MFGLLKKSLIALFIVALALIGGMAAGLPHHMTYRAEKLLAAYGLPDSRVENISYEKNHVIMGPVHIDKDGFSTISAIRAEISLPDLLMHRAFKKVIIDDLVVTGEIKESGKFDISGWNGKLPQSFQAAEVLLNSGQLDLLTPVGALRIQGKGAMTLQPDGSYKFNSVLWGSQYQLKVDASAQGMIYGPNKWLAEITLREGRINFENEKASRVSGWISADTSKSTILPYCSGQIDAGNISLGNTALSNATLVIDGTPTDYHLVLTGTVHGYEEMNLSIDFRSGSDGAAVNSSVITTKLDDLMSFLNDISLHRSTNGLYQSVLTPFLITEGNMDRLKKDITALPFDELELQVQGSLSDLVAKVVAKKAKDGVMQRRVISLNPAL